MEKLAKIRYSVAIFYSLLSILLNSPELAIVILPFLIFTERKIELKIRIPLTLIFLVVMSFIFITAIPVSITMFRVLIISALFTTMVLFEDLEYLNTKGSDRWIITVSSLLLEFCIITYILSNIKGVVW